MSRLQGVGHQSSGWVAPLCSGVLNHAHHALEGTFDKGGEDGEGNLVVPLVMG